MSKRLRGLISKVAKYGLLAFLLSVIGFSLTKVNGANKATVVDYYGKMQANGNRINGSKIKSPMQVTGMSFFWSNWSDSFYNEASVNRMVDEFQVEIVRAAYGIEDGGNPYNGSNDDQIERVVDAAINKGIYVIIDWHSHGAHQNVDAAKAFFERMAQKYGEYDNVIFELYNEPMNVDWDTVKGYAEVVIPVIRQYSDNLIVVGTPTWSQDVDHVINNQIQDSNVAYALHFYAGTHKASLRNKADLALNAGIPLFVTEWGSVNADGNGGRDENSTLEWINWMNQNEISSCNWSIFDKPETSSIYQPNSGGNGGLSDTGLFIKNLIINNTKDAPWRSR
ncbi:MAG TPA: glycoside hydrolase family 5 protein [Epulopiscium sp.]|nr:glycoside hydrolase family 5 protein [Candidatus Epulonipiscium sp.]